MANGAVYEVGQEEMSRDIGSTILRSKQDTRGTFASLANEIENVAQDSEYLIASRLVQHADA